MLTKVTFLSDTMYQICCLIISHCFHCRGENPFFVISISPQKIVLPFGISKHACSVIFKTNPWSLCEHKHTLLVCSEPFVNCVERSTFFQLWCLSLVQIIQSPSFPNAPVMLGIPHHSHHLLVTGRPGSPVDFNRFSNGLHSIFKEASKCFQSSFKVFFNWFS